MPMSKITVARTAGFCFGVTRAIKISCETAEKYGHAFTYGPLIHNNDVINDLKEKGIYVTEELKEDCSPLIIRSHGVAESVYDQLAEKKRNQICLQLVLRDAWAPTRSERGSPD